MHSAYRAEVHPNTLGTFQATYDVQPDGVPAQLLARNWEPLDVGQLGELLEGLRLRVKSLPRVPGPGVGLNEPKMMIQELDQI